MSSVMKKLFGTPDPPIRSRGDPPSDKVEKLDALENVAVELRREENLIREAVEKPLEKLGVMLQVLFVMVLIAIAVVTAVAALKDPKISAWVVLGASLANILGFAIPIFQGIWVAQAKVKRFYGQVFLLRAKKKKLQTEVKNFRESLSIAGYFINHADIRRSQRNTTITHFVTEVYAARLENLQAFFDDLANITHPFMFMLVMYAVSCLWVIALLVVSLLVIAGNAMSIWAPLPSLSLLP